jgi:Protein of unknown function (DUF3592)
VEVNVVVTVGIILFLAGMLIWAARNALTIWRLQRSGLKVRGEVTDVDTSQRRWRAGVNPRPVARYYVEGEEIEVTVGNYTGRLPTGSGVDLVVDRQQPEKAYFAYGNEFVLTIPISAVLIVLGLVLLRSLLASR